MATKEDQRISTIQASKSIETDGFIGEISGYALVYNSIGHPDSTFDEVISPGAIDNVDLTTVFALFNHDFAEVLGRTDNGTLTLTRDDKGLAYTLKVSDTTAGRDIYTNVKNGNIQNVSFRMRVADDSWTDVQGGNPLRTIKEIDAITEISIVPVPAYASSSATVTRARQIIDGKQKVKANALAFLNYLERNQG